ncbi:MAG: hypothetical protein B6244_12455 [Candidatus Cloacimonetes bacterium 4572_55]|nr:MAG: hypothetical protein B6244_12455 [Candidatus Cloacimonetes bacterium 4572_55]
MDQNPPLPNFDPDHIKIYNIDLDRAHRLFVSKKAIFIDARYPDDYITEHIPGSINLPNDMFDDFYPEVAHLFRIDDPLVIYCSGSGCDLSVLLADNLRYMGYEKLMLFEEGQPAWIAAGYPIKEGQ